MSTKEFWLSTSALGLYPGSELVNGKTQTCINTKHSPDFQNSCICLGCTKNPEISNEVNYQPQLVGAISEPSTI